MCIMSLTHRGEAVDFGKEKGLSWVAKESKSKESEESKEMKIGSRNKQQLVAGAKGCDRK